MLPVEVTPFDVQRYRDALENAGRQPAGVNRRLAALRGFFAWAIAAGHASINPVQSVKGVRQDPRTPKALTAQEVYRLQREAAAQRQLAQARAGDAVTPTLVDALRDEALLNLLLYTGLRVSECAALRVEDVVLSGKDPRVIVRSGKGRKYRTIPLHKEARKAVEAYLAVRPADRGTTPPCYRQPPGSPRTGSTGCWWKRRRNLTAPLTAGANSTAPPPNNCWKRNRRCSERVKPKISNAPTACNKKLSGSAISCCRLMSSAKRATFIPTAISPARAFCPATTSRRCRCGQGRRGGFGGGGRRASGQQAGKKNQR